MMPYLLVAVCILLTGMGHVLLKAGARKNNISPYFNAYSISGYILLLAVTICSVLALKAIDLKLLYAAMSLSYAVVLALSSILLREKLTVRGLAATLMIIAGVAIFNL